MKIQRLDKKMTGRRIKELRLAAGLSVNDLVQRIDLITPQAVYKWESGRVNPGIENLVLLSEVLKVPIDDIIVKRSTGDEEQDDLRISA